MLWNGWCLTLFARRRTGLLPGQRTESLLDSGPFRASRNPLYLGLLALHVGVALVASSVSALATAPLAAVLLEWGAIRPEEDYLRRRLGPDYDAYAARVRRWI